MKNILTVIFILLPLVAVFSQVGVEVDTVFIPKDDGEFVKQTKAQYLKAVEGVEVILPYKNEYQSIPGEIDLSHFDVGGPNISYVSNNKKDHLPTDLHERLEQDINIEQVGDEQHMIYDFTQVDYAVQVAPGKKYLMRLDYELFDPGDSKKDRGSFIIQFMPASGSKNFSKWFQLEYTEEQVATVWEVLDLGSQNISGALKLRLIRGEKITEETDHAELHIGKLEFYEYEEPEFEEDLFYYITNEETGKSLPEILEPAKKSDVQQMDEFAEKLKRSKEDYFTIKELWPSLSSDSKIYSFQLNRAKDDASSQNTYLKKTYSSVKIDPETEESEHIQWELIKLPKNSGTEKDRYLIRSPRSRKAVGSEVQNHTQFKLVNPYTAEESGNTSKEDYLNSIVKYTPANDFIIEPVDFNLEQDYSQIEYHLDYKMEERSYDIYFSGIQSNAPFKYIYIVQDHDGTGWGDPIFVWNRDYDNSLAVRGRTKVKVKDEEEKFQLKDKIISGVEWPVDYDKREIHLKLEEENFLPLFNFPLESDPITTILYAIDDDGKVYKSIRSMGEIIERDQDNNWNNKLSFHSNRTDKFPSNNYSKMKLFSTVDHTLPCRIDLGSFDWGGPMWSYRSHHFQAEGDADIRKEESVQIFKTDLEKHPGMPPYRISKFSENEELFYTVKVSESGYYLMKINYTSTDYYTEVSLNLGSEDDLVKKQIVLDRTPRIDGQPPKLGYYYEVFWIDEKVDFLQLSITHSANLDLYDLVFTKYDYERDYDFYDTWFAFQVGDSPDSEPLCLETVESDLKLGSDDSVLVRFEHKGITLKPCDSDKTDQHWRLIKLDKEGAYRIENREGLALVYYNASGVMLASKEPIKDGVKDNQESWFQYFHGPKGMLLKDVSEYTNNKYVKSQGEGAFATAKAETSLSESYRIYPRFIDYGALDEEEESSTEEEAEALAEQNTQTLFGYLRKEDDRRIFSIDRFKGIAEYDYIFVTTGPGDHPIALWDRKDKRLAVFESGDKYDVIYKDNYDLPLNSVERVLELDKIEVLGEGDGFTNPYISPASGITVHLIKPDGSIEIASIPSLKGSREEISEAMELVPKRDGDGEIVYEMETIIGDDGEEIQKAVEEVVLDGEGGVKRVKKPVMIEVPQKDDNGNTIYINNSVEDTTRVEFTTIEDGQEYLSRFKNLQLRYESHVHQIPGAIDLVKYNWGPAGISYTDSDRENKPGAIRTDEFVDIGREEVVFKESFGTENAYYLTDIQEGDHINYLTQFNQKGKYIVKFIYKSNVDQKLKVDIVNQSLDITLKNTNEKLDTLETEMDILGSLLGFHNLVIEGMGIQGDVPDKVDFKLFGLDLHIKEKVGIISGLAPTKYQLFEAETGKPLYIINDPNFEDSEAATITWKYEKPLIDSRGSNEIGLLSIREDEYELSVNDKSLIIENPGGKFKFSDEGWKKNEGKQQVVCSLVPTEILNRDIPYEYNKFNIIIYEIRGEDKDRFTRGKLLPMAVTLRKPGDNFELEMDEEDEEILDNNFVHLLIEEGNSLFNIYPYLNTLVETFRYDQNYPGTDAPIDHYFENADPDGNYSYFSLADGMFIFIKVDKHAYKVFHAGSHRYLTAVECEIDRVYWGEKNDSDYQTWILQKTDKEHFYYLKNKGRQSDKHQFLNLKKPEIIYGREERNWVGLNTLTLSADPVAFKLSKVNFKVSDKNFTISNLKDYSPKAYISIDDAKHNPIYQDYLNEFTNPLFELYNFDYFTYINDWVPFLKLIPNIKGEGFVYSGEFEFQSIFENGWIIHPQKSGYYLIESESTGLFLTALPNCKVALKYGDDSNKDTQLWKIEVRAIGYWVFRFFNKKEQKYLIDGFPEFSLGLSDQFNSDFFLRFSKTPPNTFFNHPDEFHTFYGFIKDRDGTYLESDGTSLTYSEYKKANDLSQKWKFLPEVDDDGQVRYYLVHGESGKYLDKNLRLTSSPLEADWSMFNQGSDEKATLIMDQLIGFKTSEPGGGSYLVKNSEENKPVLSPTSSQPRLYLEKGDTYLRGVELPDDLQKHYLQLKLPGTEVYFTMNDVNGFVLSNRKSGTLPLRGLHWILESSLNDFEEPYYHLILDDQPDLIVLDVEKSGKMVKSHKPDDSNLWMVVPIDIDNDVYRIVHKESLKSIDFGQWASPGTHIISKTTFQPLQLVKQDPIPGK